MSSPYPPQTPPRRLERSRSNKVLGGVCAGVAKYLNMDVALVRILTVILTLFTGVPVVVYIVALFVMPEEQPAPYAGPQTAPAPNGAAGPTAPSDTVWGPGGAPWEQGQTGAAPVADPQPSAAGFTAPAAPDPEPVAETATPQPPAGDQSSWESAPAEPDDAIPSPGGDTPPSSSPHSEGHKPAS